MKRIADSGLFIAALDARDQAHAWARGVIEREPPPWLVCEAVLAEIAASIGSATPIVEMLVAGDLEMGFDLDSEKGAVLKLLRRYADQGMDLADACVVRMSELQRDAVVFTVDKKDFSVYRRNGKQTIACVYPEPG